MMTQKTTTHTFTAEVAELLNLLAHSLYSNPEVFMRELVSNASDALDKRKMMSLLEPSQYENGEPSIDIEVNEAEKILVITDNGIGMSEEEVKNHLGSLANSGTKKFLKQHQSNDNSGKKEMIGQFGVGFYSAFVVASSVKVTTRRANAAANEAVCWVSDGQGAYELTSASMDEIGTRIELTLRDNASEFAGSWRVRQIINQYSDYVKFPIRMKDDKGELEQVNKPSALWTLSRNEISDEEYDNFYKEVSKDFEAPMAKTHNKVEGSQDYTLLLYIPNRAPFDLWQRDMKKGVKLFVNRVYIMDGVDVFLPNYMRFIRGIVDASDLPLNVSRELLQKNETVEVIKQGCIKRVLDMIENLSKDDEKYKVFWNAFGTSLKEGPVEDTVNMDRLQQLLRFNSTHGDMVSLNAYVERMKPDQKHIYFLTAESEEAARWSPHLEWFKKRDIEVLLMSDRIDEWLMSRMNTFNDKSLKSITENDLELPDVQEDDEDEVVRDVSELLTKLKAFYGDQIQDVIESKRLTESPACLVKGTEQLAPHLIKMLREAGQTVPEQKMTLGLNSKHAFITRLLDTSDDEKFADLARVLMDQAVLAEGGSLDHPMAFIQSINRLVIS